MYSVKMFAAGKDARCNRWSADGSVGRSVGRPVSRLVGLLPGRRGLLLLYFFFLQSRSLDHLDFVRAPALHKTPDPVEIVQWFLTLGT